jgi:hypothetical protein
MNTSRDGVKTDQSFPPKHRAVQEPEQDIPAWTTLQRRRALERHAKSTAEPVLTSVRIFPKGLTISK